MRKNFLKSISVGLILALTFSLSTQFAVALSGRPVLKKGMSGSDVTVLQKELKQLGFFTSNPTGYYGDLTVAAVRKFQGKYGIPATGVVAALTYNKLDLLLKPSGTGSQASGVLKSGMSGTAVTKLQQDLKTLGFMSSAATGYFGSITRDAVIKFQKYYGIEPDGIAGPVTLAGIKKLIGEKASSRGGVDRGSSLPAIKVRSLLIPGLPEIPYRNGVGKYEGVVLHFTNNYEDTAQSEADYERDTWDEAFVHEFIDPRECIRVANPDYTSWGAGEYANERFVQIELCHADNRSEFNTSFNMMALRAAQYLYKLKLGVSPAKPDGTGTLWGHIDVSNYLGGTDHDDPIAYLAKWGKTWNDVISTVTKYYNILASEDKNAQ